MIVKVPKVDTEESLAVALMMVKNEIHDDKFNASRRRILLTFLQSVDFKAINMTQSTWEDLITALRFIANQSDIEESEYALNIFADIIAARPYDTSQVMAILRPESNENNGLDHVEGARLAGGLDLDNFGVNKATDYFILKFLMCNQKTSDGLDPRSPLKAERDKNEANEQEEDDEFTISDAKTAKKYAVTSYLKLLTARVLRLEQEMAKHKKVSVIMVGDKQDEGGDADAPNEAVVEKISPAKPPGEFSFFKQEREEEKSP